MAARKQLFVSILGEYPIEAIERAFVKYCGEKDDIPAPANIKAILESDMALLKARKHLRRLKKMKELATEQFQMAGN